MEYQEQRFTSKWVRLVLAEWCIPRTIIGTARVLIAYGMCPHLKAASYGEGPLGVCKHASNCEKTLL